METKTPPPSFLEEGFTIRISESTSERLDPIYGPHAGVTTSPAYVPADSTSTAAIVKAAFTAARDAYESLQGATDRALAIAENDVRHATGTRLAAHLNANVDERLAATAVVLELSNQPARALLASHLYARIEQLLGSALTPRSYSERAMDDLIVSAAQEITRGQAVTRSEFASSDPLQAARDRGRHHALAELQRPENLALRDAAIYSGRSDRTINEARIKGQLYALVPPGKQRGLRYPQWQFEANAGRLAAVLAPFIEAGASCWVVHNFMQRPLEPLGGARPMDWIVDESKPIEPVVQTVLDRYVGEQGAA